MASRTIARHAGSLPPPNRRGRRQPAHRLAGGGHSHAVRTGGRLPDDIRDWADARGSEVALGILRDDPGGGTFQNTLVVLDEEPSFYVKRHLVPYGEYFRCRASCASGSG